MRLPRFDYARPASIAEAIALLAASPGSARLLAGGQTLIPLLAFRMAAPGLLVDMAGIAGLDRIAIRPEGISLGALVRWRDIECHPDLARAHPMLCAAVAEVAHWQIRERGTIGGSLAHADPAAELPGLAVATDATLLVAGPRGERTIAAADFFLGPLTTALAEDEILLRLDLPPWPPARRWGFLEFARRRGDFALAGIYAAYDLAADGTVADPHIAVIGAASKPMRLGAAEALLAGRVMDAAVIAAACRAAAEAVDPPDDLHGDAAYRRSLCATLLGRALHQAMERDA